VNASSGGFDRTAVRHAFAVLRGCLPSALGMGGAEAVLNALEDQFIRGRVSVPEWVSMLRAELPGMAPVAGVPQHSECRGGHAVPDAPLRSKETKADAGVDARVPASFPFFPAD
jgi:hypothetical protein